MKTKKQNFTVFLYLITDDYEDDFRNIDITNNFIFWIKKGIRPVVGDYTQDEENYYIVTKVFLNEDCMHITLKEGE